MRLRTALFLRAMLAVVMVLGMLPVMPAAPAAAAPADPWAVEWARGVSDDVGSPEHVAVASDGSYYVSGDYNLAKYAQDGSLLWTLDPGMWEGTAPSAVACDDDFVYMTLAAGWLFKFDAADGAYLWDVEIPTWDGGWPTAVPKLEVYDGAVWVQNVDGTSILQLDSENGDLIGEVPIADWWSWFEMGGIEANDDAVYLGLDDDGEWTGYQAFDRFGDKETIWSSDVGAFGDPALAPYGAALYAPYDVYSHWVPGVGPVWEAHIVAFDLSDGTEIDDFVLPDPYTNSPALSLDCDDDGAIYAVIPSTNEVIKLSQEAAPVLEEKTIDNGIIKFTVWPDGTPAAYVNFWNDYYEQWEWIEQYYNEDAWGTWLVLDGTSYSSWYGETDERFTPVSNEIEALDGGKRIVTVYDAGDSGVRVTQTVTLMDGDRYVTKDWRFENLGGQAFQHVRLYHGGDTYFGGSDSASSYYDPSKSMIYLRNEEFTDWGIMGFWANPATPASHYFGGNYSDGLDYVYTKTDLPDVADVEFQDAGYYLQWDQLALFAGQSWHVQAYETWTPGGPLQVLAPGSQNVLAGSTVVLPFTLHNIGEVPQDVTLSAESDDPAWDVEVLGETEPEVGAIERIPVPVRVTVPEDATGFANITLSVDGPETSGSGSTRLTIVEADFTVEPAEAEMRTTPGGTAEQNIVITNNGDEPLKLGMVTLSDPDNFNNGEGGGSFLEIAPGDNANFRVYFTPEELGTYPCTVYIPTTSPALLTATVQLTGICEYPDPLLTFEPDSVDFETKTGVWAWQDVTITNESDYAVELGTLTVPEPFVLGEHDLDGATLDWYESVTVEVGFYTDVSGDFTGDLEVPVAGPVTATFTVPLTGIARLAEATPVPIEGSDRYNTAIAASQEAFPDGAPAVVIATGAEFPDALGGSALAGVLDAPILLTTPNMLIEPVKAEIDRLGAERVYVLGGERALTSSVFNALTQMLGAENVTRIGGADRYVTAELVAAEVVRLLGEDYDGRAFVATGHDFADALACSPIAAAKGRPVFLASRPVISTRTVTAMKAVGVDDVVLLGGTAAVSAESASNITAAGITAERIGGANRYETAAQVAAYGVDEAGMSWDGMGIARGDTFADALVAGPALGRHGSVLLLTERASLPAPTQAALAAQAGEVETVRFFGGLVAITQTVRDAVLALL